MTQEHVTIPIFVPGMGSLENRTPSTFKTKETHKAKPRHASKAKRNFRGGERGASPNVMSSTKYVRSGGPQRHAQRVARNILRQERLAANGAARRLGMIDRRYDRRILKAAERVVDGLA